MRSLQEREEAPWSRPPKTAIVNVTFAASTAEALEEAVVVNADVVVDSRAVDVVDIVSDAAMELDAA